MSSILHPPVRLRALPALLAVLSALLLPAAASAQEEKPAADKPGQEFPLGKEPEVKVGQIYVVGKTGVWNIRCIKTEKPPEPCHIHQLVRDQDGNPVAELTFFHLPAGGPAVLGATATTPLGTLLQAGLTFQIGDEKPKQYPFNWCEAAGCVSRMGFTGLELEKLKKAKTAKMQIASILAPDKPVVLTVPLDGFAEAFKQVLVRK